MATVLARIGRSTTAITMAVALGSSGVAAVQLLSVQDEIQIGRDAQAGSLRECRWCGTRRCATMCRRSGADRDGVLLLEQAGYDPRGLLEFMEMLEAQQSRSPNAVARFFATHPAPRDRVRNLTTLVGSGGGRRDSPEFARAKRRLAQLPPAAVMP